MHFVGEKGLSQYQGGLFVSAFEFCSIWGKLVAGRVNDYFLGWRGEGSRVATRLPIIVTFHVIYIVALMLYCNTIHADSSFISLVLIGGLAGSFSAGNVLTLSVLSTEITNERFEGLVTSICNLAAKGKC